MDRPTLIMAQPRPRAHRPRLPICGWPAGSREATRRWCRQGWLAAASALLLVVSLLHAWGEEPDPGPSPAAGAAAAPDAEPLTPVLSVLGKDGKPNRTLY